MDECNSGEHPREGCRRALTGLLPRSTTHRYQFELSSWPPWQAGRGKQIFFYGNEIMTDGTLPARPASCDKKVGLVLQGGGALGSYQAGVYEALSSSGYTPDWVAGISIGAILVSYYSTKALKATLERLVDFDRINAGKEMRLSVGAVDVETGGFAYFDSCHQRREFHLKPAV
jgi:hypothetical protein